jgi:hypothetical protein
MHNSGAAVTGGAFGTATIDIRNNIFDGAFLDYRKSMPTTITAENYNNCGGVQGAPPGHNATCTGPNDFNNQDPKFVHAPTDLDLLIGSLMINAGQPGLTPSNRNVGAYPGSGQ